MKLKELRKEAGYTQKQMAEMLNITQPTYSQYENNIIEPDIKTLIKIANIFDISLDMLLEREYKKIAGKPCTEIAEELWEKD